MPLRSRFRTGRDHHRDAGHYTPARHVPREVAAAPCMAQLASRERALSALLAWTVVSEPPWPRCVQKQKRVAKPLMVELWLANNSRYTRERLAKPLMVELSVFNPHVMIDELGDGPARGS